MISKYGNHVSIMKPTPKGWPRMSVSAIYKDPHRAIDWLCEAFGFELRLKVDGEGGAVEHSELTFGEAVITVGDERRQKDKRRAMVSPASVDGANTMSACFYIDDADAHCARARAAGAKILYEPTTTDYGEAYWADRSYQAEDFEGRSWWFSQRMRG
jgi:uncharacterized glyoxalase superfamily protein PhnB